MHSGRQNTASVLHNVVDVRIVVVVIGQLVLGKLFAVVCAHQLGSLWWVPHQQKWRSDLLAPRHGIVTILQQNSHSSAASKRLDTVPPVSTHPNPRFSYTDRCESDHLRCVNDKTVLLC